MKGLNAAKWKGAAIGGVVCLIWSAFPFFIVFSGQYSLLASLSKIYTLVNFFIIPFFVYGISLFNRFNLAIIRSSSFDDVRARDLFLSIIFRLCGGALIGFYISGMASLDEGTTLFVILMCAIFSGIPRLGDLLMVGGFIIQIYLVVQYYGSLIQAPAKIIFARARARMMQVFLLTFPSLMAILGSMYLGYEAGGFVGVELRKAKLKLIEGRIKNLQKIVKKHEAILAQRNEIEQKINRIVAIDPHTLELKVTLHSEQAHKLTDNQIQTKLSELDREINMKTSLRRQAEDKLNAFENEKDELESRLKDINNRLHILEITDPANIKIKMQRLQAWKCARQDELEKIKPKGEIETLFKEQLLLSFRIKEKTREIENIREEIAHLKLKEATLQLEKLVLELEEIDRKIKHEEPRFFELKDKLNNLEIKRDQIKESLQQQQNSRARARADPSTATWWAWIAILSGAVGIIIAATAWIRKRRRKPNTG